MDATAKRALFQAAEDGDLDAVRAFFTLQSATEAIARSNGDHRLTREMAVAESIPPPHRRFESRHAHDHWYLYFPPKKIWKEQETIFKRIIEYRQFHVLEWFISRDACAVIGDTMCGLIYSLLTSAVASAKQSDAETVLEMILESDLCMEVLPPAELKFALEHLAGQAIRKKRADLVRLAVAYGVDVSDHYDEKSLQFYAAHCGPVESIRALARRCGSVRQRLRGRICL